MAKRAESPYSSGIRTADWLKVKTAQRQEVVIAGFTAPRRSRPFFGALTLAVRENGFWRYIGHVGTGFSPEARMSAGQQWIFRFRSIVAAARMNCQEDPN